MVHSHSLMSVHPFGPGECQYFIATISSDDGLSSDMVEILVFCGLEQGCQILLGT
jgi:hypothetical protein